MRHLIVLIGLAVIEKAQLARDLSDELQSQGHTVRIMDSSSTADDARLPDESRRAEESVLIWNTPAETDIDQLASRLITLEADGIRPLTIALLDNRTCECFPTVQDQLEQTADLTFHLPFELRDVLWSISTQLSAS